MSEGSSLTGGSFGLSLVIPSLNGAARMRETLASVGSQVTSVQVQVVVVDDGSSDGTSEAARGFVLPWGTAQIVRHATPRGRASACNSGIEAAASPIVVILDDDMSLEPGALEAHYRFHRDQKGSAALGRVVLPAPSRTTCFSRFLAREEENRERQLLEHPENVPFALCLTGHFSAVRALILDAGGFDTRITRYGFEDIELGYRLEENGVRIAYLPGAVARHRAYMTDLDRYLHRHLEAGQVARDLANRYPAGRFREYLRVDGPERLGIGRARSGLVALRLSNRLLLHSFVRRSLGSRGGMAAARGALRALELLGLDRVAHFGYHVVRDVRYFQGYFGEGPKTET